MKQHDWYIHRTGCEIDTIQTEHRCRNCDISTSLFSWLHDTECPNTGAPDWAALDRAETEEGFNRILARIKAEKAKRNPPGCA